MTVKTAYDLILFILNKNQVGGVSPADFNLAINAAANQYVSFLLGAYQQYQYGRAIARAEFGQNMRIRESLSPFIVTTTLGLQINSGVAGANYPSDYVAGDAMYIPTTKKRVKFVGQERLDSHINSVINPISRHPIFTITYNGFLFYPSSLTQVELSYIRKPSEVKYAFIEDGNGRPIYDEGNSRHPEWRDIDMNQVLSRTLSQFGVNLQAPIISNYAQELKTVGP